MHLKLGSETWFTPHPRLPSNPDVSPFLLIWLQVVAITGAQRMQVSCTGQRMGRGALQGVKRRVFYESSWACVILSQGLARE